MSLLTAYVREIRLFGSHARGDDGAASDLDVLYVVDTSRVGDRSQADTRISDLLQGNKSDISLYSERRLREMFETGHLFAWHLYIESKPVWSDGAGSFVESLGRPARYVGARKDIIELLEIASEAATSLRNLGSTIIYECGILYVCCRNVALIASTRANDAPIFGPQSPMQVTIPSIPFPLNDDEYMLIIAARHSVTRGAPAPDLDRIRANDIGERALRWIRSVAAWTLDECNETVF
ncbi:nucleotidyltransferase domain-containing protein [Burkholderia ambifaria]|jgi:predicted nucleotidyltransferase|uniref:nucleotidyltransferase domain-containing protein n=1 Tax=Burkholderia TaxID=32008 RepID=UPI00158F56B1|nr:nucleotidyltransferase domain-containing protein [Burkholderia ambifaria]